MYVDSSPVTSRRSADTPRGRPRPAAAAARRTRLADAIVAQWVLENVPSDHRHAPRSASNLRRELPA